jgi:hypothetical protein
MSISLRELLEQPVHRRLDQLHARVGHAGQQRQHRLRHHARDGGARGADHRAAAAAVAQRGHLFPRAVELVADVHRELAQDLAMGGGAEPARVAFEQRQPDVGLQLLEPFRERGLRHVQPLGGVADVLRLRQADQDLQVPQAQSIRPVHGPSCYVQKVMDESNSPFYEAWHRANTRHLQEQETRP